jgi:hypothetical protein
VPNREQKIRFDKEKFKGPEVPSHFKNFGVGTSDTSFV